MCVTRPQAPRPSPARCSGRDSGTLPHLFGLWRCVLLKPTARTYRHKDEDWKAAAPGAQSLSNLRPRLGGGPGNNNVGNAAALLSFS